MADKHPSAVIFCFVDVCLFVSICRVGNSCVNGKEVNCFSAVATSWPKNVNQLFLNHAQL